MKKIIAVTAGLMLAGSIVGSASAATITFSGDARARYNLEENYAGLASAGALNYVDGQGRRVQLPKSSSNDFWNSRVRLQFKIDTKGGAYAIGRFRLADGTWQGNNAGSSSPLGAATGGSVSYNNVTTYNNLFVDMGYIGVPMGPIVVEGGLGYEDFSNDFLRATSTDNYTFLRFKYATDQTTVYAFYEKLRYDPLMGTAAAPGDDIDDQRDVDQYGVNWTQKFNKDWSMNATFLYRDDQQAKLTNGPITSTNTAPDDSGVAADVLFSGKVNDIGLWAEVAYKQADYQKAGYYTGANPTYTGSNSLKDGWSNKSTTGDDGWGGYVAAKFPLPAGVAISVMAGATLNGYTASPDFGGGKQADYAPFVMLSQPTTKDLGFLGTGVLIGSYDGNAYFVNVAPSVKPNDRLTLTVEGTYMNAEYGQGTGTVQGHYREINTLNFWEVGGIAQYKVTDGATISGMLGYLNIEDSDNNPVGFGVALDLKF